SGSTQQFTTTVSNTSNTAVVWSCSSGSITSSGIFTAPTVSTTTSLTVTATSAADSTKSAQATVNVDPPGPTPPVAISVSPTSATVVSGNTQQFAATVTNASTTAVTWSASIGSISSSGLFMAPTVTSSTNATVTATSVADSTKFAQATVTVN